MISKIKSQGNQDSFFTRYKKWIVAIVSLHLVPSIVILSTIMGLFVFVYVNNDVNWHPTKSYIRSGFNSGYDAGLEDRVVGSKEHPPSTLWWSYKHETRKLKQQVVEERQDYLAQFPEDERAVKLAEMKRNNIRLPLQQQLDKRFKSGYDFYADYVKKKVLRQNYSSDEEYNQARKEEAWNVGYSVGYREGLLGYSYRTALLEIGH